jgi:predicted KAP-like P-loop ATPase
MFKSDVPIKSCKEDILGRHSFAKSLGNAILNYKEKDSIVIGLFGSWGSGKTSIINMALQHVEFATKDKAVHEKPIILKFNPWNYSDQNQLISQFFEQLSVVLKHVDHAENAKKAGKKLETYASFFKPLSLIPTIGPIASLISELLKNAGDTSKRWGEFKSNDLNSLRSELNHLLGNQPQKIIVVIDDIDRLNNTEIRQIFQLIKSLGDFPNTIYLLAFDKSVVINALKKVQEGSGDEYLEKVVQIPFEIPLISKKEVERLLFSQLDNLITDIPEEKWDQTYWGNIYHSGLKYFFHNIRDVTRYINSLRFSFQMVKNEVNAIDLLAVTGIQVFIPEVYYGIRDNKDIFTGLLGSVYGRSDVEKQQAETRCDEIIGRVNEPPQEILKDFFKRLFPKLESIYGNMNYSSSFMERWRKDCRICSPDNFDTYFSLSLPEGEISQKELNAILSLGNDSGLFAEALLKLNEDGRIVRFLDRLEDYTESDILEENIEPIITALMDTGDLFPENNTGFFGSDTPMKILRICYQFICRFDNRDKRFKIYKHAIGKAEQSLHTIVNEVGVQDQQHGKHGLSETPSPEDKLTLNSDQLEELEKLACKKIESWAEDGRLKKHRKLPSILFSWERWGQKREIDEFVSDMITDDDGLIDFITSFLSKSTSQGVSDYVGKINWRISLKSIEDFIDIKKIEPRIRKIFSSTDVSKLGDREQLAIKAFLDTIDGKIKDRF